MVTKDEALDAAGRGLAEAIRLADTLPIPEAARIAYTPTGPSIEELETRIRARRARTQTTPTTKAVS